MSTNKDISRNKRILLELKDLDKSSEELKNNGIYYYYGSDINIVYVLLIGTDNTPYHKGFYLFKFKYSERYPMQPPLVTYCTQGRLTNPINKMLYDVRFNPNLYSCGKVCLSIINTWEGPGWTPSLTIINVLNSIQAMVLNEYPLTNEPGFENANVKELMKYNEIISYANIKIAVIDMQHKLPEEFNCFRDIINEFFLDNVNYYKNYVLTKKNELNNTLIESPAYAMKLIPNYSKLYDEILFTEQELINNLISNNIKITDDDNEDNKK
jgi:ubiquitin-protein ligase